MTQQEKIREGLAEGLFKYNNPYDEWGTMPVVTQDTFRSRADRMLLWLNEQGVVIKVGEITENLAQTASQSDTYAAAGKDTFVVSWERTADIYKWFKDNGYVAVEPLIEVKDVPSK